MPSSAPSQSTSQISPTRAVVFLQRDALLQRHQFVQAALLDCLVTWSGMAAPGVPSSGE